MKKKLKILLFLSVLFFADFGYADFVQLKSGRVYRGRILESSDKKVQIETKESVFFIPFKKIHRMEGPAEVLNDYNSYKKKHPQKFLKLPDANVYDYNVKHMNQINDLSQTNRYLPKGYCGPVAASNALMWLDGIGFDNIVKNTGNPYMDQIGLAKVLGSKDYMNTKPVRGTYTRLLIRGMERYFKRRGYRNFVIGYQGIKNYSRKPPRLGWVKKNFGENTAMLLRLGFYKHNKKSYQYKRVTGHWVTLVGYGITSEKEPCSNCLIIHNSWGNRFSNDYLYMERITRGHLLRKSPKKIDAKGFYIAHGFPVPRKADLAILEGVVAIKMEPD